MFAADGPTFIWHDYMAEVAAHNELPVYDFSRPGGVTEVTIDAMSGLLPGEHTTTTVVELVREDAQPTDSDTTHRELAIEAESGKIWQEGCGDFEALPPSASPDPRGVARHPSRTSGSSSSSTAGNPITRHGTRRIAHGSSFGAAGRRS